VEKVYASEDEAYNQAVMKRRAQLDRVYDALPGYASPAFWQALETTEIALEVLVRCLRKAIACGDAQGCNHIISVIIQRTQTSNEYWARSMLNRLSLSEDERQAMVCDLCADLYEGLIRALMRPEHAFWEENFFHCLQFERKHVYRSFMMREGRWHDQHVKRSERIPRALLSSLDQPGLQTEEEMCALEMEDERAQMMLRSIELSDLLWLVLRLPGPLKTAIILIFWEGHSEKEVAQLLGITDRTVRNRVQRALQLLRERLKMEREENFYG
jgi:RNA polymerase sigma factor (sigma-70 family)